MTEESLFLAALERPDAADRQRFLDDACAGDPALRQRIDLLLAALAAGRDRLEPPARGHTRTADGPAPTADHQPGPEPGTVIAGRYKLVEKIGEGGMGEVWVAKQTEPVTRKVALKLIKPGMDSRQVLARFEAERQALALMDHPNIAKVLDGGIVTGVRSQESRVRKDNLTPDSCVLTPGDGRPFFVMELVNGRPITEFCDAARLTPRERLELFVPVCQAVQHAHQKGIIHRDLKPSNILVTLYDGKPVPKVIDFGVAKATGGKLTDESVSTQFGAVLGTIEYMAPEQAGLSALDVDTRADVYALGVILYELLTGLRPFDGQRLRRAAIDELFRILREEDPPKPSTKLSTDASLPSAAAVRGMEPRKLTALMKGELDWIVMKCLEKDRTRRYESASGLARDVERYLADEPIEAGPPSAAYRVHKFVRRNRAAVITTAAVIAGSLAAAAGQTWNLLQAREAERRAVAAEESARTGLAAAEENARQAAADRDRALKAEAEANRRKREADEQAAVARAVSEFLRRDLLGQADVANQAFGVHLPDRNSKVTVRELLDRAARAIGGKFRGQPLTEAAVRQTLADTYRGLGENALAIPHAERALALYTAHRGPGEMDTLVSKCNLAWLYCSDRRTDRAAPLFAEILTAFATRYGPDDSRTLKSKHNLAWAYHNQGKAAEAEALYREVLPALTVKLGARDPDTLRCQSNLAELYESLDQDDRADPLFRDVLAARSDQLGADHPETLQSKSSLARIAIRRGEYDRAEALFAEVLKASTTARGPDHLATLADRTNLALLYHERGDNARAEPMLAEVLAAVSNKLGPDDHSTINSKNNLAMVSQVLGKSERAERLWHEVLAAAARVPVDDHEVGRAKEGLASLYHDRGEYAQAERLYQEVLAARAAKRGPDHRFTLSVKSNLAALYWSMKRLDRSLPLFEEVVAGRRKRLGAGHPDTLSASANLGVNYRDAGRLAEALPLLEEAHHATTRYPTLEWASTSLANAYVRAGRAEALIALTAELLKKDRARLPVDSPALATQLALAGQRLLAVRAHAAAEPVLRECLAIREKAQPDGWATFNARSMLGEALAGQKKFAEAEPLLVSGYEGLKQRAATIPTEARPVRLLDALDRLVSLYDAWTKPSEAAKWRAELPPRELAPPPRETK